MPPRPPTSTLFPYTTLFRSFVTPPSSHPLGVGEPPLAAPTNLGSRPTKALDDAVHSAAELLHDRGASRRKIILLRSEEHTSELQSHSDLVCRLLLEKKKTNT